MNSSLPNCLLVDDLEENLIALKALLKDQGMNVFTARTGEEALGLMLDYEFAIAILDVQMPGMDGFELAEIMRSTERTKSIPIMFVSAAGRDMERVFQGYDAGAVDFLHKPLSPKIVLSKVKVFLELYEQKRMLLEKVRALRETEKNLQAALKSRDEFLSICSHELNTPLTSLKMHVQLLERRREKLGDEATFSPPNMEKFLRTTESGLERLIHLVSDMLDISRVSSGKLSLKLQVLNLRELAMDVVERLRPHLEFSGCEIRTLNAEDVMVAVDSFRIEQVLTNLLTNAAKYATGCPVEITVTRERDYAVVSVRVSGPGIPKADQKKIFERFERVSSDSFVTGLGLGLYISRQLTELHHGSLSVESEPGKGANFLMKIPVHSA